MKFETTKTISITPEEGQAITAALDCHVRRMKRDLLHKERIAEGLVEYGNVAMAAKISAKFPERRERIQRATELREMIAQEMKEE